MSKIKRGFCGIIFIAFVAIIFGGNFQVKATEKANSIPIVQFATTPILEYMVGDRVKFDIYSPGYSGKVEYRVTLWNDAKKEYKDLWNLNNGFPSGYYTKWQQSGNNVFTLGWPIYEVGTYRITVYAKRVGISNKATYLKGQNCDSYMKSLVFTVSPKTIQKNEISNISSIKIKLEDVLNTNVVVGVQKKFEALILPESANKESLEWSVTDIGGGPTNKAFIDSNGVLNPVAPGEIFLKAAALGDSWVYDIIKVNIFSSEKKELIAALNTANTLIDVFKGKNIGNIPEKEELAFKAPREAAISTLYENNSSPAKITSVVENLNKAIASFRDSIISEICATSSNILTNKAYTQEDPLIVELLVKGEGEFKNTLDKANFSLQGDLTTLSIEAVTPVENMKNALLLKLTGKTGASLINAKVKLDEKTVTSHSHGFEATLKKPDKNNLTSWIRQADKLISTCKVGTTVNCVSQEMMAEYSTILKTAMEVSNKDKSTQGEIDLVVSKLIASESKFKDAIIAEIYVAYDNLKANQTYTENNPLTATLSVCDSNGSTVGSENPTRNNSIIEHCSLSGDFSGLRVSTAIPQDTSGKTIFVKLVGKTGSSVSNGVLSISQGYIPYHKHGFITINKSNVLNKDEIKTLFDIKNPLININENMTVNLRINANKYIGRKVRLYFLLPPQGKFEILENGKWITLGSVYGPEGGISLNEGLYSIRFTFDNSGRYQIKAEIKLADTNEIIASDTLGVHIEKRSTLLNDAINNSQALYNKTAIGTNPTCATEMNKQTFIAEINEAIKVRDKANATESESSTALTKLSAAENAFTDAIITIIRASAISYQANKTYTESNPLEIHLYLEGSGRFMSDLTPQCVSLGGDLTGFKVMKFERLGDNHIVIRLTGTTTGNIKNGTVIMEKLVNTDHAHGFTSIVN